ncbi:THUMP domain-containing protein 2 [Corythoichthys intestinalis]|uniref:THUMP domain-containing protein 2 n=1 Tax=Corythoichthys intestinalis TaxID=161448 RepID=UPI0025A6317D|nr:THUMP domain-containing protein 2 [Corythoichthys intestinalis]
MVNKGNEVGVIRYFCSAGYGMEQFVVDEVTGKLEAQDIERLQGKVLFSSSANISRVKQLKSVERLFLLIKRDSPLKMSAHANPARVASVLKSTLMGDQQQWIHAVMTWKRLQGVVADRTEDEENEVQVMKKRRKMDFEDELTAREHDRDETSPQENRDSSPLLSFRISCKCSGALSRCLSVQEVSKVLGASLKQLGWKVDLRNPQIEITVYLNDDHCLLGVPLTRLPLANRSYIKTTGLRSTVAWAMAELAHIQAGFLVLDPMCGAGTILVEAAQEHKLACFLGLDIDDGQLNKASDNVAFAKLGDRTHIIRASSTDMPLPSASVDAVVCDLPFGRKFGSKTDMAASLPLILAEMERVLRVGGTLVLLLSPQLSCVLKKILTHKEPARSDQELQRGSQGITTIPTQGTEPPIGLMSETYPPLYSLKHQATLRLSLGAIDGLLHKYIKTYT